MKKRINKIALKLALCCAILISCISLMMCKTYAWYTDSNGNLVSDNLLDNNTSLFEQGAISNQPGVSYNVNKVSLNTRLRIRNLISLDSSTTYTISVASGFDCNVQAYNSNGYQSNETSSPFNTWAQNWTFTGYEKYAFAFRKNDNSTISLSDLSNIKIMLCEGSSVKPYEPYGIYYSESNMDKITHVNFGAFAFCDLIKVRYYNPNNLTWYDYKSFNNVYDFVQEKYVSFRNQSLTITDYTLIFVELGGDSNWRYQIYVHFPSNAIRINDYNVWAFTGANNVDLDSYTGSGYHSSNVGTLTLTSEGFSSSDYLKYIYYTRISPDIATSWGSFGTPNSSVQYNQGYNEGLEKGKDIGFDDGFTDGKTEGYTMGYNDGYRDGSAEEFTTNGFKTLIGSIFNYPINMIRSVFNFEFMGINIFSLIVFILSIGIVIFVIRRFKK